MIVFTICAILSVIELHAWYKGTENHHFSVEKGVSRQMQMNLDMVVAMTCDNVRVNIQDASGDRIVASDMLTKEDTSWAAWNRALNSPHRGGFSEYQTLEQEDPLRMMDEEEDLHVEHVLGEARRSYKRKFPKGPKVRRGEKKDSCRIYGSLEGNKVMGDFHITARGHGYFEIGEHLDHKCTFLGPCLYLHC